MAHRDHAVPQPHTYPPALPPPAAGYQPAPINQTGYQGRAPVGYQPAVAYAPPTSSLRPPVRKSRRPLIIGAVLGVIVLVAAGVGVTAFVRHMTSRPAARDLSSAWAEGSHELWTLDVSANASVRAHGDQLVVAQPGPQSDQQTVTAYDVSGPQPKQQWRTQASADDDGFRFEYWGDYLIVGDELLSPADGSAQNAPWEKGTEPEIVGTYAYHCRISDTCTGWSADAPSTTLWKTTIEDSGYAFRQRRQRVYPEANDVYQDENVTYVRVSFDKVVNIATGDVIDFELESGQWLTSTSDGWIKSDTDGNEYTVMSPSGQQMETFRGDADTTRGAPYLFDLPHISAEQYRGIITDGDYSWTRLRIDVEYNTRDDTLCTYTYFVDDTELAATAEEWNCKIDYTSYFKFSTDESLLMLTASSPMQTASALSLRGIWTVSDAELMTISDYRFDEEEAYYLLNSELIVVHDGLHNRLTAYAPGSN